MSLKKNNTCGVSTEGFLDQVLKRCAQTVNLPDERLAVVVLRLVWGSRTDNSLKDGSTPAHKAGHNAVMLAIILLLYKLLVGLQSSSTLCVCVCIWVCVFMVLWVLLWQLSSNTVTRPQEQWNTHTPTHTMVDMRCCSKYWLFSRWLHI